MERKQCFLDDEEWRTVPFKHIPKSNEDWLWDLLVKSPGLIEAAEKLNVELEASEGDYQTIATELSNGILKLQTALRSWMKGMEMQVPDGKLYREAPVAKWFRKNLPRVFETSFHFRVFFEADLILMHWSSLLNLHMLASDTQTKLRTSGHGSLADLFNIAAGPSASRVRIAFNICRSIEYCIGPDPKIIMGTASACHRPLQRAFMYFVGDPELYKEEIRWCNAVEDIVARRGPHVKGYLKDGASLVVR